MSRERPIILLITSTIAPAPDVFLLTVTDPSSRLAEYCAALEAYLALIDHGGIDHIVYADNSGHPLDDLKAIVQRRGYLDRVEFLSFRSDLGSNHNRYYLEMNLIDTAFRLSQILDLHREQTVWKVTGRYIVGNIGAIIATAPENFDLYVNCRNLPHRFLDFYLVAFRSTTYPKLLGHDLARYAGEDPPGELLLREAIDRGQFPGLTIIPRLRVTPHLVAGRRGFDGVAYNARKGRLRYLVRVLANRLVPWLWI